MNKLFRFFKNGVRTIKRERFFALVNIFGLSAGIFCFLITALYVRDELTHDKWHKNAERIFVPNSSYTANGGKEVLMVPPFAFANALKEDSPGVEAVVHLSFRGENIYISDEKEYAVDQLYYTEPDFFKVFDFSLKYGDINQALSAPNNLVISSSIAKKHYGDKNPVGQFLEIKELGQFKISGVLDPIRSNSSLQFDMLVPVNYNEAPYNDYQNSWRYATGSHYILAHEGYSIEQLTQESIAVKKKNQDEDGLGIKFLKFSDMYMSGETYGIGTRVFGGQKRYVVIFSLVGMLVLLTSCFNYINLNVSRTMARTKDLAIRKIVGASKFKLISHLFGETVFLTTISMLIALIGAELLLPEINSLLDKRLELAYYSQPELILIPLIAFVLVLILSGVYPAIVSSTFNMATLLKGVSPKSKISAFRKSMLILQFVICTGLITSALIIRGQAKYMINMDLGYNTENVENIGVFTGGFEGKYNELKTELERIPLIEDVSGSSLPRFWFSHLMSVKDDLGEQNQIHFRKANADIDFTSLLELEVVKGRAFHELDDSELIGAVLINQAALKQINVSEPVGMKLGNTYKVVGVLKDFHFASAKEAIEPVLIELNTSEVSNIHIKFKEGNRDAVMLQVEEVWNSFETNKPFKTTAIATFFSKSYGREETLLKVFNALTLILITIALLGLFALSSFEGQLREKEVSIRKVLGASYFGILKALNRKFIWLILMALVISIPTTYLLINKWLVNFPYRVENVVPYFVSACSGVVIMGILILGFHGYKTSRKNPVEILRNE